MAKAKAKATKAPPKSKAPTKTAARATPKRKAAPKSAKPAASKQSVVPRSSSLPTRKIRFTKSTQPTAIPTGNAKVDSLVRDYVFFIFRGCYGGSEFTSIDEILAIDPNEWDVDPSPFYTTLEAVFGVADESKSYFDGYGGRIKDTIDFISSRWKGGALPPKTSAGIPWDGG